MGRKKLSWDFRRPRGHEGQPLLEWYIEQVAISIILFVGKRAYKRKDLTTFNRMLALTTAGRDAELGKEMK